MLKYVLVAYLRIDGEDEAWMMDRYDEALEEKRQQELIFPENIYLPRMRDLKKEVFKVVLLDARNQLIKEVTGSG